MTRTAYDEVPYVSGPVATTHPDYLSTHAQLLGLDAPPADHCRVLELGCGDGGNLIPLALQLPTSSFLGIDLSSTQVDTGTKLYRQLGLTNIELRAGDIQEFGDDQGMFDYILCHGVFSWVPPAIQHKILSICQSQLAENGVAYISYNAYPGWHFRAIVRDILLFETRDLTDPQQRLSQARAYLQFLRDALPDNAPMQPLIASACELFNDAADWYLLHEYLEQDNRPLYFHEFMQMAEPYQLQYLGEASSDTRFDDFTAEVQQTIRQISGSWLDIEQHVDFVSTRTFRRTLLCHARAQLSRTADLQRVAQLAVATQAVPSGDEADLLTDAPMQFRKDAGRAVTTNNPALKVTLWELWRRQPEAVPVRQLQSIVEARLRQADASATASTELVAEAVLRCYLGFLVSLHSVPDRFTLDAGDRPLASPLARAQVERGAQIVNLRHTLIEIDPFPASVLKYLDGHHTLDQIADALGAASPAGESEPDLLPDGPTEGPARRSAIRGQVQLAIDQIARKGLLLPLP